MSEFANKTSEEPEVILSVTIFLRHANHFYFIFIPIFF